MEQSCFSGLCGFGYYTCNLGNPFSYVLALDRTSPLSWNVLISDWRFLHYKGNFWHMVVHPLSSVLILVSTPNWKNSCKARLLRWRCQRYLSLLHLLLHCWNVGQSKGCQPPRYNIWQPRHAKLQGFGNRCCKMNLAENALFFSWVARPQSMHKNVDPEPPRSHTHKNNQ